MERRKLIKGLGAGAFGMIASGISSDAVAGRADDEVDLSFVHPELMSVAAVLARVDMQFNAKTLPLIRSGRGLGEIAELGSTPKRRTAVPITERRVPVAGHPDVLVYVINSGQNRGRPAILHAHGGGFISGSAKSDLGSGPIKALADLVVG